MHKKSYDGWKEWYLEKYPDAIEKATELVNLNVDNIKEAIKLIDKPMVRDWIEDLVIVKTAEGFIVQDIILKHIAKARGKDWRNSTPEEESEGIDGFIGDMPVSIKPSTYLAKRSSVREDIKIEMIYYKKPHLIFISILTMKRNEIKF